LHSLKRLVDDGSAALPVKARAEAKLNNTKVREMSL